jgi:hypothetical protein
MIDRSPCPFGVERFGEVDGVAKNGVNESHVQRQQGEGSQNEGINSLQLFWVTMK